MCSAARKTQRSFADRPLHSKEKHQYPAANRQLGGLTRTDETKRGPKHPKWKSKEPFKAVLDNDLKALEAEGEKGVVELVMASHAGVSTAEFEAIVTDWLDKARHPRFKRRYTELACQPMLEILAFLRANGFKTYIVTGGGKTDSS